MLSSANIRQRCTFFNVSCELRPAQSCYHVTVDWRDRPTCLSLISGNHFKLWTLMASVCSTTRIALSVTFHSVTACCCVHFRVRLLPGRHGWHESRTTPPNAIIHCGPRKGTTFIFMIILAHMDPFFSPLHSGANCRRRWNKIYHLALDQLLRNLNVPLYTVHCDAKSFI